MCGRLFYFNAQFLELAHITKTRTKTGYEQIFLSQSPVIKEFCFPEGVTARVKERTGVRG